MVRELWVRDGEWSWHERLREAGVSGYVSLDPADADHGPPARAYRFHDGHVRDWRFLGSVDPGGDPIGLLAAAWTLASSSLPGEPVLLFAARESPVHRHLALTIAQALHPERVIVPKGSALGTWPWPVGAEEHPATPDLPPLVREAQRRARWLELLERATLHTLPLATTPIQGARLGSGRRFRAPEWQGIAEAGAGSLFLVGDGEPDEVAAGPAMALAHAGKLVASAPRSYSGLVCSFARQDGEDFAMGVVERLDVARDEVVVRSDAIPPAPVRILRLGRLRIDGSGREVGEARPWTV